MWRQARPLAGVAGVGGRSREYVMLEVPGGQFWGTKTVVESDGDGGGIVCACCAVVVFCSDSSVKTLARKL